jgi:hypothetical protein
MRTLAILVAAFAVIVLEGCGSQAARSRAADALVRAPGNEAGATSGDWGDGAWDAHGLRLGYLEGRRFRLLFTLRNRTSSPLVLLGAGGAQRAHSLLRRVAVQVRPAPPPPKGDLGVTGLRRWSSALPRPVTVPAGRDAWVQVDFVMRGACRWFDPGARQTVNRSILVHYRDGAEATQRIDLGGDQITVALPASACTARPQAWQRLLTDLYDGRLDERWPCATLQDAVARLPASPPTYSVLPDVLRRAARRGCD